jgi:hypothetical protein
MTTEPCAGEYAALAERVLSGLDALVRRMASAYQDEIPQYAEMSCEALEREVLPVSRGFVSEFFSRIIDGEIDPTPATGLEAAAQRRLEMGLSVDSPLHAFRVASRVVWQEVVEVAGPGDEQHLGDLAAAWLDYMDRTSSSFASAYLKASHESLRRADARRRELLETLVSATDRLDLGAISARYATPLADSYSPVLLEGDRASVVIDHLLDAAPRGTIGGPRGVRVLLLVPGEVSRVRRLVRTAEPALATWGRPATPGAALLREVIQAESVLDAARFVGRDRGIFGPNDLIPERLLAGTPTVTRLLAETVLEPLRTKDDAGTFRETLRHFLETGSVPEVAKHLLVHVNTVGYRLRRVHELTELDPRVPRDAAVLLLALKSEAELS